MGRAIVRQPKAFLMDEPLSNLDAKLRVQMRAEISSLQHDLNVTTVYVTHDQIEAMTMGDRVAVMSKGYLQQVDTRRTCTTTRHNLFVAALHRLAADEPAAWRTPSTDGGGSIRLGSATCAGDGGGGRDAGRVQRPRGCGRAPAGALSMRAVDGSTDGKCSSGTVAVREGLGSEVILHVEVDVVGVDTEADS